MNALPGTMAKRCRHCADGVVVLFAKGGRVEMACHCARGVEMEARRFGALRARMLAAFNEAAREARS